MSPTQPPKTDTGRLFCEVSSIRGLHKISIRTGFLRIVWVGFVIVMTVILLISSSFLLVDYLNYTTAWHTSTERDDLSDFPAVTICAHNPFSANANELWKSGKIRSPSQMTSLLTQYTLTGIKEMSAIAAMRLYDKYDTYYSNLQLNQSIQLSHEPNFMRYCIFISPTSIDVNENCKLEPYSHFKVKLFSNDNYFNCYTVEALHGTSSNITDVILVVALVPSEDFPELANSFLLDTLSRGEGLKLVIHEVGRYPDVENNGINLHPERLNGIVYSPTRWKMHSTPVKHCTDDMPPFYDLNRKFNYTFRQCLDMELQNYIIQKCHCMVTFLPRPFLPKKRVPYCLNVFDDWNTNKLNERMNCLQKALLKESEVRDTAAEEKCIHRCSYMTYATEISSTKWRASKNKLELLKNLNRRFSQWESNPEDKQIVKNLTDLVKASDPAMKKNVNNGQSRAITASKDNVLSDKFTYISLHRKNKDTTFKKEKLVLDMNVLLSRVGGLCSLCIGLTAAVVVETVEFLYFWLQNRFSRQTSSGTTHEDREKTNGGSGAEELVGLNGEVSCDRLKTVNYCVDCHCPT